MTSEREAAINEAAGKLLEDVFRKTRQYLIALDVVQAARRDFGEAQEQLRISLVVFSQLRISLDEAWPIAVAQYGRFGDPPHGNPDEYRKPIEVQIRRGWNSSYAEPIPGTPSVNENYRRMQSLGFDSIEDLMDAYEALKDNAEVKRLSERLHLLEKHPDFEYATTHCMMDARGLVPERPDGAGWEPNRAYYDGERVVARQRERYWRRPKVRVAD